MNRRALIAALALALPAAAQDARDALPAVGGCLDVAADDAAARACVGTYARGCMMATSGENAAAITACTAAESGAWDRLLHEEFAAIVVALRERAAVAEQAGAPPPLDASLRDAQRAWTVFRDADCAYDVAVWDDGTLAELAGLYCLLDHTTQRVLELRTKRAALEQQ